jgi:hypothetical protein
LPEYSPPTPIPTFANIPPTYSPTIDNNKDNQPPGQDTINTISNDDYLNEKNEEKIITYAIEDIYLLFAALFLIFISCYFRRYFCSFCGCCASRSAQSSVYSPVPQNDIELGQLGNTAAKYDQWGRAIR